MANNRTERDGLVGAVPSRVEWIVLTDPGRSPRVFFSSSYNSEAALDMERMAVKMFVGQ